MFLYMWHKGNAKTDQNNKTMYTMQIYIHTKWFHYEGQIFLRKCRNMLKYPNPQSNLSSVHIKAG